MFATAHHSPFFFFYSFPVTVGFGFLVSSFSFDVLSWDLEALGMNGCFSGSKLGIGESTFNMVSSSYY